MAKKKVVETKVVEKKVRVKYDPVKSVLRALYWLIILGFISAVLYIGYEAFVGVMKATH